MENAHFASICLTRSISVFKQFTYNASINPARIKIELMPFTKSDNWIWAVSS